MGTEASPAPHPHTHSNDSVQANEVSAGSAEEPLLGRPATPSPPVAADEPLTPPPGEILRRLVALAGPDTRLLIVAFTCGMAAAVGQARIPYYTGKAIDAASDTAIDWTVFHELIEKLLAAAVFTAVFAAGRGSLFTLISVRVNKRLRERLFEHLLAQDVAFFDATKTGEVTSRLSADCSTVADQVSLNANVLVRSLMQGAAVLFMMLAASWRLTVVTFILIPVNIQARGRFLADTAFSAACVQAPCAHVQ